MPSTSSSPATTPRQRWMKVSGSSFTGWKADVAEGIDLPNVDVLVGQRVQPHRAEERLLGFDQQDCLGKARIVEAAAEMHPRLDGEDLEPVGAKPRDVGRVHDLRQVLAQDHEIV